MGDDKHYNSSKEQESADEEEDAKVPEVQKELKRLGYVVVHPARSLSPLPPSPLRSATPPSLSLLQPVQSQASSPGREPGITLPPTPSPPLPKTVPKRSIQLQLFVKSHL